MKKFILSFLLIAFAICSEAQNANISDSLFKFDKRFSQCENKWVVFPPANGNYSYGFIYLDEMAGFTYNLEGFFKLENGKLNIDTSNSGKNKTYGMKYRLAPNTKKVSLIPMALDKELKTQTNPDWLYVYNNYSDTISHNVKWGTHYNAVDECSIALTFLEPVYLRSPHYKGLEFELAYAYNALKAYDKAINILESAIKNNPNDCLLYKELAFSVMHKEEFEKAEDICTKGIKICTDKKLKAEISYNLTYQFYKNKNKEKFSTWAEETRRWIDEGDQFSKMLRQMEIDLNK